MKCILHDYIVHQYVQFSIFCPSLKSEGHIFPMQRNGEMFGDRSRFQYLTLGPISQVAALGLFSSSYYVQNGLAWLGLWIEFQPKSIMRMRRRQESTGDGVISAHNRRPFRPPSLWEVSNIWPCGAHVDTHTNTHTHTHHTRTRARRHAVRTHAGRQAGTHARTHTHAHTHTHK